MKKSLIFLAVACIVLLCAACGENNLPDNSRVTSNTSITFSVDDDTSTEETLTDAETSDAEGEESESKKDSDEETSKKSSSANTSSKKTTSKTNSKAVSSKAESEESTEPEDTEYTVSAEEVESQLSGYESEISGEWKSEVILDADNQEVDGAAIYGTAYTQYGGSLTLSDDGTFSVMLGVSASDESTQGTYSYSGGSEINLLYYNDTSVDCERVTINDQEAIAMPLEIMGDVFTVYFTRA